MYYVHYLKHRNQWGSNKYHLRNMRNEQLTNCCTKQIGLRFLLRSQNAHALPHQRLQILIRKSLHRTNRTVCLNYKTLFKQQTVRIFVTTCVLAQKKDVLLRGTADFRCVTWISHWVTTPFQACLNKALGFYNPNCTVMICARLVDCWGRAIETDKNSKHCLPN